MWIMLVQQIKVQELAKVWPDAFGSIEKQTASTLETESHYFGYLDKQLSEIARFKKEETLVLPIDLDYWQLNSLSIEEKVSATHRQHPSPLPSFLQLTQHALF